jgi:rare lipoprotein A
MYILSTRIIAMLFCLVFCFCNKTKEKIQEEKLKNIFVAEGYACWYGSDFEGKRTANGDTFRKNKLTAAHRFLEFGTKVKVTYLENNKSVVVEINDRGPFSKGKILDLSEQAAKTIGLYAKGSGLVQIELCGYKTANFEYLLKHYKNILMINKYNKHID